MSRPDAAMRGRVMDTPCPSAPTREHSVSLQPPNTQKELRKPTRLHFLYHNKRRLHHRPQAFFFSCVSLLFSSNHPGVRLRDHDDQNFGLPTGQLLK